MKPKRLVIFTADDPLGEGHVDDVLLNLSQQKRTSCGVDMHTHSYLEITLVLEGSAIHVTGGVRERLQPGDVIIIPAGSSHAMESRRDYSSILLYCVEDMAEKIGLNLSFIYEMNKLFSRGAPPQVVHLNGIEFNDARKILGSMLTACRERTATVGNLRGSLAFFICLVSMAHLREPDISGNADVRILKTAQYMERHLAEDLTVPALAARAALSENQFIRLFKAQFNMPPFAYLLSLRIHAAGDLLRRTKLSVSEIALRSGFRDPNHFSTVFLRHTGVTPSVFRRNGQVPER